MPAKKRARPAASRRTTPRKPARKVARKPARKPAARKPVRKAAPKPARKPAPKVSRKPARKAATKPKRAVRAPKARRRGVSTLPIPPSRSRGPKRRRRAPEPPEITPQVVIEDEPAGAVVAPETPAEITDGEQVDARRYVAVVSEIEGTEPFPAQQTPLFPLREQRRAGAEAFATDVPIALGAVLLIASVFLPWYKGPKGFPLSISGWTSGTLAPLLVFLGAASLVLVVLRRGGAAVGLPVEESLAHEGVGWLALVAAVVKTRWRPDVFDVSITPSYGVWLAIAASALLVVFGGRMSPRAPLVTQPGWLRSRGGVLGAALLIVVVAGSSVFGAVNSPKQNPVSATPSQFPGSVRNKLPDCAKDFPLPAGLKPEVGFDRDATCQAQLTSTKASTALIDEFRATLKGKRWTFTETPLLPGAVQFSITKPVCVRATILPMQQGSVMAFAYTPCSQLSPTPSPATTTP